MTIHPVEQFVSSAFGVVFVGWIVMVVRVLKHRGKEKR